ncbi:hypothetical protein JCM3775_007250 [Rhodotorula graminis]|uniref:Glycoside hydrolase family 76 protein n=1 Tax=Rhodotorula graminis (strain WP1) TaxID=578459 RepID=A0A194SES8_RHOGW|nr:glycoside hydrolase family 76 protein [Rhodotorula graminis WP1]KPV78016.1 glycoside hydrolase family 76 protein [Rhodotorula graminis WP1]
MPAPPRAPLVVVVAAAACFVSALVLAAPVVDQLQPNQSPAIYEPYLAFPHPIPHTGRAFLPNSPHPLLADIRLPDNPTNPAPRPVPAYDRHPLYVPGKPHNFSTTEFKFDPRDKLDKRALVSSVDIPFPPSAWMDINDMSKVAQLAQAAVARMQTWYEDGLFEWTGWWQTPVLGIAYTNLDLALGNHVNELLIKDLLIKNDDLGWMIDKYVDDQSWWAMYALRAHQAYPNSTWLDMVETINNNNTLYWDDTCGGGVLWLTYRPLIKNTITNGLYFSILTRLYRLTGNETYFEHSMNTLNWWLEWAFDTDNGRVYDTVTASYAGEPLSSCTRSGEQTWTYNSGAFLFGLADLYYATGDERVLDLGRTIAYAAMRDYVPDELTGVLVEGCEDDPPPGEGKPPGCQQDETVFKGILMLGMSELYLARPDPNIYNFVNTQLLSNVYNNVDDSWLFGMWWGGPWNETTAGPKTQLNAICLIAAAATINADYLSSVGRSVSPGSATDQIAVPESTATGVAGSTDRSVTGAAPRAQEAPAWVAVSAVGVALGAGAAVLWA